MRGERRVTIVGCGAIGGLLAVRLSLAGVHVILVRRRRSGPQADRSTPITLVAGDGVSRAVIPVTDSDCKPPEEADAVFIAVKAYQVDDALRECGNLIRRSRNVVFLQSWLPELHVQELRCHSNVWCAGLMVGAMGGGSGGLVCETGPGFVQVGRFPRRDRATRGDKCVPELVSLATKCLVVDDIEAAMFAKVALSAATFPACVLARGSFGRAFSSPGRLQKAVGALRDCVGLWHRMWPRRRLRLVGIDVGGPLSVRSAEAVIEKLVRVYPAVIPSVVFDVVRGGPTEFPFFHDELVSLADQIGAEVSELRKLVFETKRLLRN